MYQQELARSGKRLFFVRGLYIYTIIAIGTLWAWQTGLRGPFDSDAANNGWFWLSFAVAASGAIIRVVTSGFAALGTSGRAKVAAEAAELNTTGPYSLVRNPLYVGRILNFTGLAMLSGSWIFGALVFLIAVLVYERISIYEEEYLRDKFGTAHSDWAAKVPALMPRLTGWCGANRISCSCWRLQFFSIGSRGLVLTGQRFRTRRWAGSQLTPRSW
jgi:Phospholipid methyltransferase